MVFELRRDCDFFIKTHKNISLEIEELLDIIQNLLKNNPMMKNENFSY